MRAASLVATVLGMALVAAPAAADPGPALSVDPSADRRAISPDIYGMNFADPVLAREIGLPVDRWGGNKTERYNWQAGLANAAADYFFESRPTAGRHRADTARRRARLSCAGTATSSRRTARRGRGRCLPCR